SRPWPGAHRQHRYLRRVDHGNDLRGVHDLPDPGDETARVRARRIGADRRDDRPHDARPGVHARRRQMELVDATLARSHAARAQALPGIGARLAPVPRSAHVDAPSRDTCALSRTGFGGELGQSWMWNGRVAITTSVRASSTVSRSRPRWLWRISWRRLVGRISGIRTVIVTLSASIDSMYRTTVRISRRLGSSRTSIGIPGAHSSQSCLIRTHSSSSPATATAMTVSPSDSAALTARSVSRLTVEVGTITMLSRRQG